MRRIRFKARALKTGKMVEGYYAHQHIANFDADGQHIIDYDEQDTIYNDEPGNRNGSYWINRNAMSADKHGRYVLQSDMGARQGKALQPT